jgi:hypothetical protein
MRTIIWKEFREQATVWVAVAALAVLALAGLRSIAPPQGNADEVTAHVLVVVGLAVTYGLVCGAMLLAGEVEGGSLAFLDTLPALRRQVWGAKLVAGVLLALLQGLLLGGVALALGLEPLTGLGMSREPTAQPAAWQWLVLLPAVTVEACCWGLLGSALCRHVLPAVVVAALFLVVPWLVGMPPAWKDDPIGLLVRVALAMAALSVSALVFTVPDRERRAPGRGRARAPDEAPSRPSSSRVLLWLAARQSRGWLLFLGVGGFLSALVLAGFGPIYWPVLTLLVGVACGSTVFLGEQTQGTYRFLGEQRVPLGLVWLWKTGFWLVVAVAVALLVLVGGLLHLAIASTPGQGPNSADGGAWALFDVGIRFGRLVAPWTVFGLWLLYGFSIALTCGLAWRKSAAALFMSLVLSVAAGVVWVPSLLGGGLPAWQVFVPPVVLLVVNRLLLRSWVSDRLYTWKPLAGLTFGGLLAVAWVAGCLGGRVASLSDLEEPAEGSAFAQAVRTFEDQLPKPEQNESGSLIRQALARLKDGEAGTTEPRPGAPGPRAADNHNRVVQVLEQGWTDPNGELGNWLDGQFAGEWAAKLREGAGGPPGMIDDPRRADWLRSPDLLGQCEWAGCLVTARALQLQAGGDDRAGLQHLATALGLARQLRHHGTSFGWMAGVGVEKTALQGLDHWLQRVGPRPKLLREALAELTRHEQALPDASEAVLGDYLSCRETLDNTDALLRLCGYEDRSLPQGLNAAVLVTAWAAPWEKARVDEILASVFAGRLRGVEAGYALLAAQRQQAEAVLLARGHVALDDWLAAGRGPAGTAQRDRLAGLLSQSWLEDILDRRPSLALLQAYSLCRVRGDRLVLALALYEAENHKPAPSLDTLTEGGILAELPRDPFSPTQQGFGYRVSEGEDILWDLQGEPGRAQLHIKPGHGVVWSSGPDLVDNGGHAQGLGLSLSAQRSPSKGRDWIFLVPESR